MLKMYTPGKIESGQKYENWYIYIKEYNDGSYLVLISTINDFEEQSKSENGEGYDNWLRDRASLELMIERNQWEIRWLE